MTNPDRHDLLGYLVDALEPDERLAVEQSLRQDPALKEELRCVRSRLEILKDDDIGCTGLDGAGSEGAASECTEWDCSPPAGLADRTLQFVAEQREAALFERADQFEHAAIGDSASFADRDAGAALQLEPVGKRSWRGKVAREPSALATHPWRFIDIAVTLAVCLAGASLIFPVLNASRSNARIVACANNLREIGMALTQYSEHQNGFFPRVAETGSLAAGGIYAPTLLSGGYVSDPRLFICPGSSQADDSSLRIPTVADLQRASGNELSQLRRQMGGSYGYALGYRQGGVYRPTRNLYRDSFALVADMPSPDCTSSPNHSGNGHNVLLEDGHIVFLKSCRLEGSTDDIFTNDEGKAAAGCHVNDAVVVRSDVSP